MFSLRGSAPRLKFSQINSTNLHHSEKLLESFPIHSVHFLIPSSNACKEVYEDEMLSDDCTYFIVKDMPATCLIQKEFLDYFVKSGKLYCTTHDARVEIENFLSVIPPGKLVLSLEKSIAQSLALHKENIKKKKGKRLFQTVIIDLTCPELYPGKKHHHFISSELSKIDCITFNLLVRWKPSGNACPHSIKSFFTSQGFECTAYKPKHKEFLKFSVPVPKLNFEIKDSDILNNVLEWIGMQICGLQYSTDEDDYLSKLTVPESFEINGILYRCSFEGFYSKVDILPVIKEMSKIFENDTSLPFIAVCMSGFQDAFVQANGFQFFSSDDKFICILIFPSSNYWLLTLNCR